MSEASRVRRTRSEGAVTTAFAERGEEAYLNTYGVDSSAAGVPSVSVVIPCYNEELFIEKVLSNLATQYDHEKYEIIIVDGMSSDKTRAVVAEFAATNPEVRVRLVDNPARNIPTALNTGIREARGDIIVRMDAHSIPSNNYVRRCVELLKGSDIAVVGMPWIIKPGTDTLTARAIALAVSHPFGIGDAKYRLSRPSSQYVDTVPFGVFRKSLWQELGGFNEYLLANEDYDFYYRVRCRDGRILLDTAGHCAYFARASFKELAIQYFRYGGWKAQMVKMHPRSIRWRQLVAPAFVSSLILLTALGLRWTLALWMLLAIVTSYAALGLYFAFKCSQRGGALRLTLPVSFAFLIIHTAWGSSFLLGLIRRPPRR
ncbi:MAG: glycosyltransferase family 2 protein [Acidobacteriota bacterium]|nr:glycosyltransferase family 2 protein [Acidobacteriota bacterium]